MEQFSIGEIVHSGELYDVINKFDFDLPFYQKWFKTLVGEGKILELCCGTGRLTIPLVKSGFSVKGLDFTPSMLDRAKEKADKENLSIEWILGDIRDFHLEETFDLIFIPFNSLQGIYSIEDVEKVFSCVKKHLKSNGTFIFDIFNPNIDFMVSTKEGWHPYGDYILPDQTKLHIDQNCFYDMAHQVNKVKWRYMTEVREWIEPLDMRCFYPLEMDALLKYNGFRLLHKFGDFLENPFQASSSKQIFICNLL